ncbi:SCO family protein, partial [Jannaschia formosa]|uniref:SCO family protein n=1 Tax=Jannaschia formosa TaxID=2259592 RepID=UPI001ADDD069
MQPDLEGPTQLIFFDYGSCQSICAVALPVIPEVAAMLANRGVLVVALVIIIDPSRDSVGTIGPALVLQLRIFSRCGSLRYVEREWRVGRWHLRSWQVRWWTGVR